MHYRGTVGVIVLICMIACPGCSTFHFDAHDDFFEWYVGKSGYDRAIYDEFCETIESRHWLYLHFRLPELIFNPQGGFQYPERCYLSRGGGWYHLEKGVVDSDIDNRFTGRDDGLVEILFSYRSLNVRQVDGSEYEKAGMLKDSLNRLIIYPMSLIFRLPLYAAHDVLKTAAIPFAAVHFATEPEGRQTAEMRARTEQHKFIASLHFYAGNSRNSHMRSFNTFWQSYIASRVNGIVRYAPPDARIHAVVIAYDDEELALQIGRMVVREMERRGIPASRIAEPRGRSMNDFEKQIYRRSDSIRLFLVVAPAGSTEMYESSRESYTERNRRERWSDLEK